jgi:hypothetical protein
VYYLAKFAGILGLDVQDMGAAQTGMSKDAFKAMLVASQQPDTGRLSQQHDTRHGETMAKIVGGMTTSHVPAIGGAIARACRTSRTGSPFSTAFCRCATGWTKSSPTSRWCSTTTMA